jgi:hypothetical protein
MSAPIDHVQESPVPQSYISQTYASPTYASKDPIAEDCIDKAPMTSEIRLSVAFAILALMFWGAYMLMILSGEVPEMVAIGLR